MSAGSRRVIGFAPGLLYAVGLTALGIVAAVWLGGSDAGDSAVGRELARTLGMALFLLVIVPAVLAWGGVVGSALGARWAYVLLTVPAIGHTVLVVGLALVKASPQLLLVAGPAVLVTAVAAVTSPWMRRRAGEVVR
jgi:cation transporter-like permease